MLFDSLAYCLRNLLAVRRTDNFLVQVEPDDDCDGRPVHTVERSAQMGEELLRELSKSSRSACKSSIRNAAELTQSFVQRYPGLASIRVQLGDDVVQSRGNDSTFLGCTGPTLARKIEGVISIKVALAARTADWP